MNQCTKLLEALKQGPLTKPQIWRRLRILNGGGRIHDLRGMGHNIRTDMIQAGRSKVARYTLMKGKKK